MLPARKGANVAVRSTEGKRAPEGAFAENAGVRIYYEVQGSGPPLFLHHGFTQSIESWRQFGYIDAFAASYRVIAMDARGHGRSDKPHDEAAYTMEARAGDVLAVLAAAGAGRVHFWGYSMGGRTGFALLQRFPDRIASFVCGGIAPTSPKLEEDRIRQWAAELNGGDLSAMAQEFQIPEPLLRQGLGGNDLQALAAAQLGLLSWGGVDPSTLNVRSLQYAGQHDSVLPRIKRAAEAMPGAIFRMIPGVNHLTAFARSDLVIPLVRQFLAEVKER